MASVAYERFELNGKARKGRKATAPVSANKVRQGITLGMGCGIPCLSLALSNIGGRLVGEGHCVLGTGAMLLCCGVLAVSLSHLAWAVRDITRSAWWQSWCLAVAIDLSLVLGELASVAGFDSWLVSGVMMSVCVVSAVLNCWAFLRHR
jgi:hypothetical protein